MGAPKDRSNWLTLGAAAASLAFVLPAGAGMGAPPLREIVAATPTPRAARAADEDVRKRVKTALRADPYFYDAHVEVGIEKGRIVLRGFVFSDWDLRNAMRIAREAAGDMPVISDLAIQEGGRR